VHASIDDSTKGNVNPGLIAQVASAVVITVCIVAAILVLKQSRGIGKSRWEHDNDNDSERDHENQDKTIPEFNTTAAQVEGLPRKMHFASLLINTQADILKESLTSTEVSGALCEVSEAHKLGILEGHSELDLNGRKEIGRGARRNSRSLAVWKMDRKKTNREQQNNECHLHTSVRPDVNS
jgi:hypothetical protein